MMHYYQKYSTFGDPFLLIGKFLIPVTIGIILIVGLIALKGFALWHAAKRDEKGWFAALLIVNTMGILELAYLTFVVKKWSALKNSQTWAVTQINTDKK